MAPHSHYNFIGNHQLAWLTANKIIQSKPAQCDQTLAFTLTTVFIIVSVVRKLEQVKWLCGWLQSRKIEELFQVDMSVSLVWELSVMCRGLCTVLTPFHSTLILTSSPPSGPLSYFTVSEFRLSRLRCFSRASGSLSTSATRCLCTLSRPWCVHTTINKCQFNKSN